MAAIDELEAGLVEIPGDEYWMMLLAQCLHWSGQDDKAIETAKRIAQNDPRAFLALKLLGDIYVQRNDRQNAVGFVAKALEYYPAPTQELSRRFISSIRRLAKLLPPLRRLDEENFHFLADPSAADREWFEWAKKYLSWHDGVTGDKSLPVVH